MTSLKYRYAMYDLNSCLEMVRTLHENGAALSPDTLAHQLGYKSANNGAFNTRLANARLFGLIEGSNELRPSRRALAILFPDRPEAARAARLEAFEAVPLFAAVLHEYHGQPLPTEQGLKNALTTRWGINTEKVAYVYARLMDSAEQAGLFDVAGSRSKMLRPSSARALLEETEVVPAPTLHSAPAATSASIPAPAVVISGGLASNQLISAALAELPEVSEISEEHLLEWLKFFESALRVVYRLPRSGGKG